MSQEQRMDREVDGDNNGEGAPVLLLATLPADANWLHIYASNLSAEFLDRLDHPSSPLLPATVVPPAPSTAAGWPLSHTTRYRNVWPPW